MVLKSGKRFSIAFLFLYIGVFSQENEITPTAKITDYKNDSSYQHFNELRYDVAKAQINLLKKDGALLVRLKNNANTIAKLKAAGNIDLATQVERETAIKNKIIMASYLQEFTFCPVYFFYSNFSDSVKYKKLDGVFLDSTLTLNSSIICNAKFYLIAESGKVNNSSLGIVPLSQAPNAIERGTPSREASIVVKNRFFIQLHKPFPNFQIKSNDDILIKQTSQLSYLDLSVLIKEASKIIDSSRELKQLKKLKGCVNAFNNNLNLFYQKNKDFITPPEINNYVY